MDRRSVRHWCALALAAATALGAVTAAAEDGSGLQISPIRLDLGPGQRGGALTLTNMSAQRKTVQVEVLAWTQAADGADVYTPTRGLLANPPLFFLEPGASQVVRVGLPAGAATVSAEQAYRVYLGEVPQDRPGASDGLRVALRFGIPVFVVPPGRIAAQPQWSGRLQRDGSIELKLCNNGSAHLRLAELRLLPASGVQPLAKDPTLRYALAGARQTWKLKPTQTLAPGPARISALTEDGVREWPLVLE